MLTYIIKINGENVGVGTEVIMRKTKNWVYEALYECSTCRFVPYRTHVTSITSFYLVNFVLDSLKSMDKESIGSSVARYFVGD